MYLVVKQLQSAEEAQYPHTKVIYSLSLLYWVILNIFIINLGSKSRAGDPSGVLTV